MKTMTALLALLVLSALPAFAAQQIDCRKLWDLEKELGCFAYNPMPQQQPAEKQNFVLESQFGPSECKASNVLASAKKELKTECDSWVKERKSDLGDKFMTGTCNDKCDSCGQGLQRCLTTGLVHYSGK